MDANNERTLRVLQEGNLTLEGQFVYGSNTTFMVTAQMEDLEIKAVYKPVRGERPLWDFPQQTLAKREVAAYLVSEALGWGLVPPTVFRTDETLMGPGSLQQFIDHNPEYHFFTFSEADKALLPVVMLYDHLVNNADRKSGHLLVDPEGKLWLIDHGVCFHKEDKLRTVIWEHAGESIPANLLVDLAQLLPALESDGTLAAALTPYLLPSEIHALRERGQWLLETGIYPIPPEERRAYPWPLV
ncbi:MAG: SCO1664 family protein [Anaerolineaceae bacterium]|nr:SCO1664 family protein [Anaerolineaceae bacterium]